MSERSYRKHNRIDYKSKLSLNGLTKFELSIAKEFSPAFWLIIELYGLKKLEPATALEVSKNGMEKIEVKPSILALIQKFKER